MKQDSDFKKAYQGAFTQWLTDKMEQDKIGTATLAEWMRCSQSTVSKMLNFQGSKVPDILELFLLSQALGITMEDIILEVLDIMADCADPVGATAKKLKEANRSSTRSNAGSVLRLSSEQQEDLLTLLELFQRSRNFPSRDH